MSPGVKLLLICLSSLMILLGVNMARAESQVISRTVDGGALYATLELPDSPPPWRLALIHPGSGPTDRDGNSAGLPGSNNSLKLLAEALADHGVASLRIDKRGIGQSVIAGLSEDQMTFEQYIDDAVQWLMPYRSDGRFSGLTVIGHSEGALIGLLAAKQMGADAYVSLSGPGEPAADILRRQLSAQLPPALLSAVSDTLSILEQEQTVSDLPAAITSVPALTALLRPSVQPYLISWFRYDPVQELRRTNFPVMIIQGDNDLQVRVDDARLLSAARPDAELLIVEGMNHVLKITPTDPAANMAAYSDPALPLAYGLAAAIAEFLNR